MPSIPQEPTILLSVGLITILLLVAVLPFLIKRVEENLEIFFLLMGIIAVTISGLWSWELVKEAAKSPVMIGNTPIGIFQVVLVMGFIIYYFNKPFYHGINYLAEKLSPKIFIFTFVVLLGLCSSIISVIVTAVVLAEVMVVLPFRRKDKIGLAIIACFAVGLGGGLTPIGEPLSTILVHKLTGAPYYADFSFPFRLLGAYIIPGVIAIAILGAIYIGRRVSEQTKEIHEERAEGIKTVIIRAVKVYFFIAALILLGEGLSPLVMWYFTKVEPYLLYWINMISAVLDNATLTAIEISPSLTLTQIKSAIMSLLISGGMLIPGNIPNIVTAARLKIKMKEWTVIGVPMGLVLLSTYFIILLFTL